MIINIKEINPIINSNNPFLYNYNPDFMNELYIYNLYSELDGETIYLDSITNENNYNKFCITTKILSIFHMIVFYFFY
jgi:hypothetical protein